MVVQFTIPDLYPCRVPIVALVTFNELNRAFIIFMVNPNSCKLFLFNIFIWS